MYIFLVPSSKTFIFPLGTSTVFFDDFPHFHPLLHRLFVVVASVREGITKRHIHEGGKYCFFIIVDSSPRSESTHHISLRLTIQMTINRLRNECNKIVCPESVDPHCRFRRCTPYIGKCSTVRKSNKFSSLHRLQLKCCRFTVKILFHIYTYLIIASFRSLSLQSPAPFVGASAALENVYFILSFAYFALVAWRCCRLL